MFTATLILGKTLLYSSVVAKPPTGKVAAIANESVAQLDLTCAHHTRMIGSTFLDSGKHAATFGAKV